MFSLKIWRHYLYRVHVDVLTDHKSLQYVFTQKELNFQQKILLELLKDYDISVLYHLGKVNVVVYTLSKVLKGCVSHVPDDKKYLLKEVHRLA